MKWREKDEKIESVVAGFLDAYFYPRFDLKFSRLSNVKDKELQTCGVDVVACGKNIDEKVKIRRNLNKLLNGISFEIARRPWPFKQHTTGWFVDPKNITDNYLFVSVFSTQDNEDAISMDNIDHLVCLSVRKPEVYNYIGMTPKDLVNKTCELGKSAMSELKEGTVPDWCNKPRLWLNGGPCYIVMSWNIKKEMPFNLVIPREIIKTLPGTAEYHCSRASVKKLP